MCSLLANILFISTLRHSDPPITMPINDMNNYFNRFDTEVSSFNCNSICQTIQYCSPINLTELDVVASISKIKPGKVGGPDGISGKVLKSCCHQLKSVLTRLFQALLQAGIVPSLWKESVIVPIPKGPSVYTVNDFRPIALTSVLCKTMERILAKYLMSSVGSSTDPLQFAYRRNRGTDDAVLTMMNFVTCHLQNSNSNARILFLDFTSAFNTMRVDILLERLISLGVNRCLVLWIKDFLLSRTQRVWYNGQLSDECTVNTGAPQGSVISPVLFSLYINDFIIHNSNFKLFKYADDMALVGLLQKNDINESVEYMKYVEELLGWCKNSALILNINKTKELVISRTRQDVAVVPVSIESHSVEIVDNIKYLGTFFDSKLSFVDNTNYILKKCMQRLFLIQRISRFGVSQNILEIAYKSLVESVLTYNLTSWYGHLNCKQKNSLARVTNIASKIIGRPQSKLGEVYTSRCVGKAERILKDPTHPLCDQFVLLPSGR